MAKKGRFNKFFYGCTAVLSVAICATGAYALVDYSHYTNAQQNIQIAPTPDKPNTPNIDTPVSPNTPQTSLAEWVISGDTILGYAGNTLPSTLVFPSTYSLGEEKAYNTVLQTEQEVNAWVSKIKNLYYQSENRRVTNQTDKILNFSYSGSHGFGTITTYNELIQFQLEKHHPVTITELKKELKSGTDVTIKNIAASFSSLAFDEAELAKVETVILPDNFENFSFSDINSLNYFPNLKTIRVSESNSTVYTLDDVLIRKTDNAILAFPSGKTGTYTMPGALTFDNTKSYEMFRNSQLNKFVFNNNVQYIPSYLFRGSKITEIELSQSVKVIQDCAFMLSKLDTINLQNSSVQTIQSYAFRGTKIAGDLILPDTLHSVWDYAFDNCDLLTSISFGANFGTLWYGAFDGCDMLTSITLDSKIIPANINGVARVDIFVEGVPIYVPAEYLEYYLDTYPNYNFIAKQ